MRLLPSREGRPSGVRSGRGTPWRPVTGGRGREREDGREERLRLGSHPRGSIAPRQRPVRPSSLGSEQRLVQSHPVITPLCPPPRLALRLCLRDVREAVANVADAALRATLARRLANLEECIYDADEWGVPRRGPAKASLASPRRMRGGQAGDAPLHCVRSRPRPCDGGLWTLCCGSYLQDASLAGCTSCGVALSVPDRPCVIKQVCLCHAVLEQYLRDATLSVC